MAITPACILQESRRTCFITAPEAALRSSVSRSYYAFYHASLSYADKVSIPPVSDTVGSTHQKLSVFYQNSFSPDKDHRLLLRKVGYLLKRLHTARVKADYYLDEQVSYADAESVLVSSEAGVDLISVIASSQAA